MEREYCHMLHYKYVYASQQHIESKIVAKPVILSTNFIEYKTCHTYDSTTVVQNFFP